MPKPATEFTDHREYRLVGGERGVADVRLPRATVDATGELAAAPFRVSVDSRLRPLGLSSLNFQGPLGSPAKAVRDVINPAKIAAARARIDDMFG
jgi:hypothetical protein